MNFSSLFAFLFSILVWQTASAQKSDPSELVSKVIQKNGQQFLKHKSITSVSIGVYKDDQFYTGHFGELQKEKGKLPNDETIYEIGSVSKPVTGHLVAKSVIDGKIELEKDVRTYLKGNYSNLKYSGKPITTKHLLTHTSGLPMFLPIEMNEVFETLNEDIPQRYLELEKTYSKDQFLKDLKEVAITTEPGTSYSYSNVGAELLGHILETVYNKSIDELLKESFSHKHDMHTNSIQLDSTQQGKMVQGYWMNNESPSPNQLNTLWGTAGGIKMTILDVLKFARLQLNTEDTAVIESHKVLYEEGKTFKRAYFWEVWKDKYGTSYNHHGGTTGTQNWLFIYPKYKLGISIMTNQSGPKTPRLLSKTAKKILKEAI